MKHLTLIDYICMCVQLEKRGGQLVLRVWFRFKGWILVQGFLISKVLGFGFWFLGLVYCLSFQLYYVLAFGKGVALGTGFSIFAWFLVLGFGFRVSVS